MNKTAEIEKMNEKIEQSAKSPLENIVQESKSPLKNMKKIPEYHVFYNDQAGVIYSGVVNKKGDKWLHQSDVTQECLAAVRDHFINIMKHQEEGTEIVGYQWKTETGKTVTLQLTIADETEGSEI